MVTHDALQNGETLGQGQGVRRQRLDQRLLRVGQLVDVFRGDTAGGKQVPAVRFHLAQGEQTVKPAEDCLRLGVGGRGTPRSKASAASRCT